MNLFTSLISKVSGIIFFWLIGMFHSPIKKCVFNALAVIAQRLPLWRTAPLVDLAPQLEWLRVNSPINIRQLPKDFACLFVRAKNIPSRKIFELRNVCVTAQGVVFKNLRIFTPSLPWIHDLKDFQKIDLLRCQWRKGLRTINERPLVLAYDHWAMCNYYHWMIESLPRLYIAKSLFQDCTILLPDSVHEYVTTSLDLLGIEKQVRIGEEEVIRVDQLIMPEIVYYNGVENEDSPPAVREKLIPHPLVKQEAITLVRKTLLENFPVSVEPFRKVYVSRSRSKIRRLANEGEVIPILIKHGFEIVFFEGMSLVEQIRLMRETKTFAGVHGSNMVNILFLTEKAVVVELMNEHQVNDAFYLLSSSIDMNYYSVPCKMADENLKHSANSVVINDADLKVDPQMFDALLSDICTGISDATSVNHAPLQNMSIGTT
jgi:capsular polysaccharide biosynthesis protein